jgi:hypothetical protein
MNTESVSRGVDPENDAYADGKVESDDPKYGEAEEFSLGAAPATPRRG